MTNTKPRLALALEYFVFRFSYIGKAAARSRIDFGILQNGICLCAIIAIHAFL
jgi:hypothetical protein